MLKHRTSLTWLVFLTLVISAFLAVVPAFAQPLEQAPSQKLRVGICVIEPFVIDVGNHYTGYSIDLWEEIARGLGVETEYVLYNSVDDQIQAVKAGEVDVAISSISMTASRESEVDFTQAYYISGLRILTLPHQRKLSDLLVPVWGIAILQLLAVSIIAALVLAHIIYIMERQSHPSFTRGYLWGVWEGFWYLITIIATGEYGDKETARATRRIITIVCWLLGIVFIANFTATVASSLTVQQLSPAINSPSDLLNGKKVVTVENTEIPNILTAYQIPFKTVPLMTDAYSLLDQHQVDAVVLTAPVLEYYAAHAGHGKAIVVGPAFGHVALSMAVSTGSPLRKEIDEMIVKLNDTGVLAKINEIWFGKLY